MIGPILLFVTWALLRLERKNLNVIGINKPGIRLKQFTIAFLVTAVCASLQQLLLAIATGNNWTINPEINLNILLEGLRFNINTILYEELLFRGYLLYQAIRWLGGMRGCLLSAVFFGIYHWFSYGAFGNPVAMTFIFIQTGFFGLLLSYSFRHTGSIAAPIGLHFGWNFMSYSIFSAGPLGAQLLIPSGDSIQLKVEGLAWIGLQLFFPLAVSLGLLSALNKWHAHNVKNAI